MGPVHGSRLSPRSLRRHRRASRALRGGGPHGRLLPHPHPGPAQGQGPAGPVGGGPGDRTPQRHPGTPDPLPAARAGRAQPPRLHRPRGGRPRRGYGRHLRLLHLPLLWHLHSHRATQLGQGWRPRGHHGRSPRSGRPAKDEGGAVVGVGRPELADQLHPAPEQEVRRQATWRHRGDAGPGASLRDVRPAPRGEPRDLNRRPGHQRAHPPRLRLPPLRNHRQRRHPDR